MIKSKTKFSPYEEAIKRNLKEYYEKKNRVLNSLLHFDVFDWMKVEFIEIDGVGDDHSYK